MDSAREHDAPAEPPRPGPNRALSSAAAWGLFLLVTALGLGSDLWSKSAVFASLLRSPDLDARVHREVQQLRAYPGEDLPPEDSEIFTRIVLERLGLGRDLCCGVDLTLRTNPGVVFGFDAIPRGLVAAVTVLMVGAILVVFAFSPARSTWLHAALGLLLGGAVGNLYDRLASVVRLPGLSPIRYHVRDFIDCGDLYYPYVFNLADVWLVVGVAMIALHWLAEEIRHKRTPASESTKDTA